MQQKEMPLYDTSKKCNITFIIGNGFDLGLGMKTKYTDVYERYIHSPSSSEVITKFKKELEGKDSNNYEKWSDFEMGMADYAKELSSEDDLIQCVRDFKSSMVQHLSDENESILKLIFDAGYAKSLITEFKRSVEHFYEGLIPNDISRLKSITTNSTIVRNYITFNYTTTLEGFLSLIARDNNVFEKEPIHIHGKLGENIVLGVDDWDALIGAKYPITKKVERAFIKPLFNAQFDNLRIEAAKKAIWDSSIICIYGFSMGESDNTWVWEISDWLEKDKNHHLVVYQYDTPQCNPCNYDKIMEIEDERKAKLLSRLCIEDSAILDQIHIPIGKNIFNFTFAKIVGANVPKPPITIH